MRSALDLLPISAGKNRQSDVATQTGCPRQSRVAGQQRAVVAFGRRDVCAVVAAQVGAKLPHPRQQMGGVHVFDACRAQCLQGIPTPKLADPAAKKSATGSRERFDDEVFWGV